MASSCGCEFITDITAPAPAKPAWAVPMANIAPTLKRDRFHAGGSIVSPRMPACMTRSVFLQGLEGLGYDIGLTPEDQANLQMADSVAGAVTTAYAKAALALGLRLQMGAADWALDTLNVSDALRHNFIDLGKRIIDWRTRLRGYAEAGKTPEGVSFDLKKWADLGKVFGDSASSMASVSWDSSPLNVVWKTVATTAQQANPLNPTEWPTWLKVGAGIAALAGAAYLVNTAVKAKEAFLPPPRPRLEGVLRRSKKRRSKKSR